MKRNSSRKVSGRNNQRMLLLYLSPFSCVYRMEEPKFLYLFVQGKKIKWTCGCVGMKWRNRRWMVVGRFTGLIDKFPTLGSFSEIDFGLSVVSIGSSCRIHRVSCRMQNFQKKWDQGLGKDNNNGGMDYEGRMQPIHVFFSCVTLLQPTIHSKEANFFFFNETAGAPPGGFHPHCLPWVPPRGFHPEIFYSFFCFFYFFFIYYYFYYDLSINFFFFFEVTL